MQVYSVSDITAYLRELLESNPVLADLWIGGEVSNLHRSAAGHLYFTLKDGESQLRCVCFQTYRLPVLPEDGHAVIGHGRVSIYEATGALQFYVDLIQPAGLGILQLEFERLRLKLEEEGLFEPARKRPLPAFPQRIGVVTSAQGAVFHDIINVITRRYPLVELVLTPTPVQGDAAVPGIVRGLDALNRADGVDVIIVARGGGSLEELWAFNEEAVARAIFASRVPVISGVGHETDVTIADLVADARAPTPSAAAEMAVPDRRELWVRVEGCRQALTSTLAAQLAHCHGDVRLAEGGLRALAPDVARRQERTAELLRTASLYLSGMLEQRHERVRSLRLLIDSLSPLGTLERGYAIVEDVASSQVVSSIEKVSAGDHVEVHVRDGHFRGRVLSRGKGYGRQGNLL